MKSEPLIVACTSDFAGKVRGKAFPQDQFEKRQKRGIGWTPTNVQITCFDMIAESPFGALGDLVLIPAPETRVSLDYQDDLPAEQFVFGDILHTDGRPWECCTRSLLKAALDRLEALSGLTLHGAFEHEFHIKDGGCALGSAYTASGFRLQRTFGEKLLSAMRSAGLKPDTFMKEYGVDQYEVTMGTSDGIAIADHAAILRELVYVTAEHTDRQASFTPLRDPAGVGNGVHLHLSLRDAAGNPVTYDPDGKDGLSEPAGRFIAGILKYLDRIVAITAPSVVSYTRLTPHRWSAAYNNLGLRDREAAVRICPVSELSDVSVADQFNFEFRAADAAASPYLAMAAIVHAGVQGIEEALAQPDATEEDVSILSEQALKEKGLVRLPGTLEDALDAFSSSDIVKDWFSAEFVDVYTRHKKGEMAFLTDKSEAEICAAYEAAY
ncbi:glutamine synthetase family protein [Hoeflea poritis]|uniref:Glutamine synthetase family protein n=1 Tax=Hoeflea poritis TaxID=2993659 RepID=A0ABT4VJY3_9HYPH|nr:glutamine synthetase family protein [Hoeflea poritis]MDA4844417.1 glutamine synthetase family protein [Hoeflea poritis]